MRGRVEPDDVAQEVLMAAHRGMGEFQGNDVRAFLAWVFRIAENRIRDLVDHFGAAKRQAVERGSLTQTSPSGAVLRSEAVGRVRRALEVLPDDHRQVIQLRRLEEVSVEEVARIMGRSANAIRVLYCRAIQALRLALAHEGETPPP
jgi:RNA polymerase sigma-70 factor (ECF subfamily)